MDPFVLARSSTSTVVPAQNVESTISGLFSPFFVIIDVFLGRKIFKSTISQEFIDK